MSTRVGLLNSTASLWNDRDLYAIFKDFVGANGGGVVNVDRAVTHLTNGDFSNGSGSISADGWIGSDANNGWFADIGGTATVDFDLVNFSVAPQSLRIVQTVNSGTDITRVRLTQNPTGSFTTSDLLNLIPVKPGKTYRASVNIRTSGVSSGFGGGAQIAMSGYDSTGTLVGVELFSTPITGSAGFQAVTLDFAAASNVVYLAVEMRIKNETGTVNFDGISMVELGTDCQVIAQTIPNNTVTVKTGVAYFNITDPSANQFLVRYEVTAQQNVSVTNNVSGLDRIDLVVLKYDNTVTPNVTASNIGLIQVIAGTPAASPVAPAVPANSIAIAQIYMANGATVVTSGQITDRRTQMKWQNMDFLNSMGTQPEQKKPATASHLGQVVLSDAPTDPNIPVAIGENYGGLLTPAEKSALLAGVPALGEVFEFGHNVLAGMNVAMESDGLVYMTRPKSFSTFSSGAGSGNNVDINRPRFGFLIDMAGGTKRFYSYLKTQSGDGNGIRTLQVNLDPVTGTVTSAVDVADISSGGSFNWFQIIKISNSKALALYQEGGQILGRILSGLDAAYTVNTETILSTLNVKCAGCSIGSDPDVAFLFYAESGVGIRARHLDIDTPTPDGPLLEGLYTLFASTDALEVIEAHQLGTTEKIVVLFRNTTAGTMNILVAQWSEAGVSFTSTGTPVTIPSSFNSVSCDVLSDDNLILMGCQLDTGTPFVTGVTISGVVPTIGSAVSTLTAKGSTTLVKIQKISDYHAIAMTDVGGTVRDRIIEINTSNRLSVSLVGAEASNNLIAKVIAPFLPNILVCVFGDPAGNNTLRALHTMTLNHSGYIGVVSADVVDYTVDNTESVKFGGLIENTIDDLVPGTEYYTENSGGFTVTNFGNKKIGVAVDTNSIIKD